MPTTKLHFPPPHTPSPPLPPLNSHLSLPANSGLGKGWGHGVTMSSASPTTPLPEASVAVTRETAFATKSEGFTGGIEALSPFRPGHGPVLSRVGTVDLGPVTPGCGRAAVAELGKRMLQLEAAVSKQDT